VNNRIVVLGGELQAAVSMALSRTDVHFLFISERDAVDGWDLENVEIRKAGPEEFNSDGDSINAIALSPRWLRCVQRDADRYALSRILNLIAAEFPEWAAPVSKISPEHGWMLKGDLFHRPDGTVEGAGGTYVEHVDLYGCGNVYQRRIKRLATTLAMGRRADAQNCALGLVRIHSEAFAREDFLMAGESVKDVEIERRSRAILDALDHVGFFSMNWVTDSDGRTWCTSFRPVPRAAFQLFRAGGVDLLQDPAGQVTVDANHRFVVDHHYARYR
jgi:hypothetical protein